MSAIFISHSNAPGDNVDFANTLAAWLSAERFPRFFLDFDPDHGIAGGRDWEEEIYRAIAACRVVVALCSPKSMSSRWVPAEVICARSQKKPVIAVKISDEEGPVTAEQLGWLASDQYIDASGGWNDDVQARLLRALRRAGVAPNDFQLPEGRDPYPGLYAFEAEDAAIFFGRENEIQEAIDRLETLRRKGTATIVNVLGASGSGKSSFVRAGVVPRLRHNAAHWLTLPPFKPHRDPFTGLARSLLGMGEVEPDESAVSEMADTLAGPLDSDGPNPLLEHLRGAYPQEGQDGPTAVVVIDQLEDLFGIEPAQREPFVRLLLGALSDGRNGQPPRVLILTTLRSDRWREFESTFPNIVPQSIEIGRMGPDDIRRVIEGPADHANNAFHFEPRRGAEPGLVDILVEEAQGSHMLPLLAFTLRKLWEEHGQDAYLEISEYEALGRLNGAVGSAAQATLEAYSSEIDRPVEELEGELRACFRYLVRWTDTGVLARREAPQSEFPQESRGLLETLVDDRLLVSRRPTLGEEDDRDDDGSSPSHGAATIGDEEVGLEPILEVAHESLFEAWAPLREWLALDRPFLEWRHGLDAARVAWEATGRNEDALLPDIRLRDALDRLDAGYTQISAAQQEFIDQSVVRQELLDAARKARRRRAFALGGVGLAAALAAGVVLDLQRRTRIEQQHYASVANTILELDERADPLMRALLLAELADIGDHRPEEGLSAAFETLRHRIPLAAVRDTSSRIVTSALDFTGQRLLVGRADGSILVWSAGGRGRLDSLGRHLDGVRAVDFSRDGGLLLSIGSDAAKFWSDGDEQSALEVSMPVEDAVPFGDGFGVLARQGPGSLTAWRVGPNERTRVGTLDFRGTLRRGSGRLSPDARRALLVTVGDTVWVYDTDGRTEAVALPHGDRVFTAEFSTDGSRVITTSQDRRARVWDSESPSLVFASPPHDGSIANGALLSPDGALLIAAAEDGTATGWWTTGGGSVTLDGHDAEVIDASFSPDGRFVLTSAVDGTARVWDAASAEPLAVLRHDARSRVTAEFSGDGRRILSLAEGEARVWRHAPPIPTDESLTTDVIDFAQPLIADWLISATLVARHAAPVRSVGYRPDGAAVLSGSTDGVARVTGLARADSPFSIQAGRAGSTLKAQFDASGERVVTRIRDERVARIWAVPGDTTPVFVLTHDEQINTLEVDPTNGRVVTGSNDGYARVWAASDGELLSALAGHGDEVGALVSEDGSKVLTWAFNVPGLADNSAVLLHNTSGGGVPDTLGIFPEISAADLSADRRTAVLGGDDGGVRLLAIAQGGKLESVRMLDSAHTARVSEIALSPDGRWGASVAGRSGLLWSVPNPTDAEPLIHDERIEHLSFSPDGTLLLTAGRDGRAKLWSVGDGELRGEIRDTSEVRSAGFSPDGRHVVLGSEDGRVTVWALDLPLLVRYARASTSGCLTRRQRMDHLRETADDAEAKVRECLLRESGANP